MTQAGKFVTTKKSNRKIPKDIGRLRELLDVVARGKYMWESTFDAIQDPVLVIDHQYRIERANVAAAQRAHLKDIRELIGRTCYEDFAGRKTICPGCPLTKTLEQKRAHTAQILQMMTDGDFQVNSYPLVKDLRTRKYHVVHHYRDVTEERALQRQLIQSEKMAAIGMIAGGIAHEVNNPLGGILAFTQLLRREVPADSRAQSDLGEIENAARRCKKIVEDLLVFARPSRGEAERLEINPLVEQVLPMARLHLRQQNVTLATDFAPTVSVIEGDAARLQQVFLNLINNAAQAMPQGGEVTVRTAARDSTPAGRFVVVEVVDRGSGISKEDLSHIFDPFFTTKKKREGTGLGLSVCQSIIQDHHGKIEVESEAGRGSLFRVLLPAFLEKRR